MLNRQRMILALLNHAGAPVQNTMLVKLAFLLREETAVGRDQTFYGFVPYKQGPFSFGMYRELETLERDGYVVRGDNSIGLAEHTMKLSREQIERLSPVQAEAVASVVKEYGSRKRADLLRSVYDRYPWYATRSELHQYVPEDVPAPQKRPAAAYTVGYEGKSVDGFFDGLLRSGMRGILDVRANPISRKYGFAKRSMSRIAGHLGLAYHHMPELGITGSHRADLSDFDSYQRLLDQYEKKILPKKRSYIAQATELLSAQPTTLLCMEKDVRCCHRGRLASRVAEESALRVEHL